MAAKRTDWFRKKLRYDKQFLLIYKAVHASCDRLPAPNGKHKLIKCLVLTMNYLAQGGQIDQGASTLGISRSRFVVYINNMLRVFGKMAARYVRMPTLEELGAVEDGFAKITGFSGVIGAIDGTLVAIHAHVILRAGATGKKMRSTSNLSLITWAHFAPSQFVQAPTMTNLCGMNLQ